MTQLECKPMFLASKPEDASQYWQCQSSSTSEQKLPEQVQAIQEPQAASKMSEQSLQRHSPMGPELHQHILFAIFVIVTVTFEWSLYQVFSVQTALDPGSLQPHPILQIDIKIFVLIFFKFFFSNAQCIDKVEEEIIKTLGLYQDSLWDSILLKTIINSWVRKVRAGMGVLRHHSTPSLFMDQYRSPDLQLRQQFIYRHVQPFDCNTRLSPAKFKPENCAIGF